MPQTSASAPYAVLFDMDGTLVNTEPLWAVAETELLAEYGLSWSPEQAEELTGWALEQAAEHLRGYGVPLGVEEVIGRLEQQVMAQLRGDLPWVAPTRDLLAECAQRGVPVALVTMSRRAMADIVIAAAPGRFDFSVTGDEVVHPKPDPWPYLHAAEALGVPPHRCIAIEDSSTGAQAARDAGCTVYTVGPQAGQILGLPALPPNPTLDELVPVTSA